MSAIIDLCWYIEEVHCWGPVLKGILTDIQRCNDNSTPLDVLSCYADGNAQLTAPQTTTPNGVPFKNTPDRMRSLVLDVR